MASLLNENCGCVIPTGTGWEAETTAFINQLQGVVGLVPTALGDALNDIVLAAGSGGGNITGPLILANTGDTLILA